MFSSKKKEKEELSTSSSGASNYHETTTVKQSNNGTTITTTKQVSSSQTLGFSRQERSYSVSHSNSAGNFSALSTQDRPLSLASSSSFTGSGSRVFGSNSPSTSSFPALQTDAFPFNYGAVSRGPALSASISPALRGTTALAPSASRTSVSGLPRTSLNNPSSASGITYISPYFTSSGSFPLRSRQPVLETIATQNAAQNQNIAQSVPATTNNIVPTYLNKSARLGRALIINNVKFMEKGEERDGAKKDSKDLEKLLRNIGFKVEHKMDLKGKEMAKQVKEFSKSNFSGYDISLVVIMSHGNNIVTDGKTVSRVRGGFTQIAGIDNVPVLTDEFTDNFTAVNSHSSLKGKAKIFIFQCCRGEKDLEICKDAAPIRTPLKEYADILIAFSTLPGYLSNRDPKTGTWYIQSLCEVLQKHHKAFHIEELLKIVDEELGKKHPKFKQTSTYESRGFKRCFLYKNSS